MPSLTHAEAIARAAAITARAYTVDCDLTRGDRTFRSTSKILFSCTADRTRTFLDLTPENLIMVTLDSEPIDVEARDGRLLLDDLAAGPHEIVVVADLAYTNTGQGLHRFTDPADGAVYVCATTSPDAADHVFACFDQPDMKATFALTVTVDPRSIAVSNSAGRQIAPGRWEFTATKPISTYLTTLVVGPLHRVDDEHDGIPLALYARASLAAHLDRQAAEIFAITKACFDHYHELFGIRYPFGKYDQVFVPELMWGAMENPGCVTFRDELVFTSAVTDAQREQRAETIAHEMAHMWFGDLVTMRWWDDLWLNESFADYLSHRTVVAVSEFTSAWTSFAIGRKAWGYAADQRPSTHPVAPEHVADTDAAMRNFDGISYAKGSAILRQLVAWLGDDVFFAGLRTHIAAHAYGNATLADLLDALGAASGRDLTAWAQVWLRTTGVNTLRAEVTVDATGAYESVEIVQTTPVLRPHRITVSTWDGARVAWREALEVAGERTRIDVLTGRPAADLLLLNDGDLTYAKIRLDPAGAAALPATLPAIEDSLTRALLWGAAWDATRDADTPPGEFIDLCAAALPGEDNIAIIANVLRYATDFTIDRYLLPEQRDDARARLATACRAALAAAAPGSGRQLAAARGLIRCDTATARTWLAGDGVPDGLTIDAELRWLLLAPLAAAGEASAEDIDREADRDRTATGGVNAARCRALLPDAERKEVAWAHLIDDDTLSGKMLTAIASGFWHPDQAALTACYVERYAGDMAEMARRRPAHVATRLAEAAYPHYAVSADALACLTAAATADGIPESLRHALVNADDDLSRSLAARSLATAPHGR